VGAAPLSVFAPARPRVGRLELAVPRDRVALAALAVLVTLLVVLTWQTWGDFGQDTGYDLVAGARVAHGQLPYRDFFYYYGPLAPFVLGFAALIGGSGIGPAVAVGLVLACSIVLATYVLGRMYAGVVGGFLAAAITAPVAFAPTNFSFVMPHSFSVTLALLTSLCFLISLGRYAQCGRERWLAAAGLSTGLVLLTRPEFSIAVLAAAVLWFVLRIRSGQGTRREVALFAGPALGVPAVVYGSFLTAVSPHRLIFENLYPAHLLRDGGSAVLKAYAPLTVSSFVSLGGKLLLYSAAIVVLLALAEALARGGRARFAATAAAVGAALVLVVVAAARPESVRYYLSYAYGWIPAGIAVAVVVLLARYRRRGGTWSSAAQAELAGAVFLAVLAGKTYADFLIYAHIPQLAAYAIPFAAVFLASLHLVELGRLRTGALLGAAWLVFLAGVGAELTIKDARAQSATVRGPGGTMAATPPEARMYQQALSWIERTTPRGKPILVAPQLTSLYVLSGRTDPLPQISLLPGALASPADERDAIARLERDGVRTVVTSRRVYADEHQTAFGGSFDHVLAAWIHRTFRHVATLRAGGAVPALDVWVSR
jgi:hypothetical protein